MSSKKNKKLITPAQEERIRKLADTDPINAVKELRATVAARVGLAKARKYSVDAISRTPKRRTPVSSTGSLDQELPSEYDRRTMISTSRDIFFNYALPAGILRGHVKNMIGHGPRLQMTTEDDEYNARAENYWNRRKDLIDVRGMSFAESIQVGESREVVDGDYGVVLVKGGQTQHIEGDRIQDPPGDKKTRGRKYVSGVEMTREGIPIAYHIWNRGRTKNQMRYGGRIEAKNFIHCFRPSRFDQARGFPWLISAVNDMQDLRETFEAAKGKMKIENMLGLAIKSQMPEADEITSLWGGLTPYQESDAEGNDENRYEVQMGQGVHSFQLRDGEEIQVIESKTPNQYFEPMTLLLVRQISLPLDMPLEIALQFFTRGSYSGHRAAFIQYFEAAKQRRSQIEHNRLDREAGWVLRRAIKAERLEGPKDESVNPTSHIWQWPGLALLDPDRQRKGDTTGYKLGVESLADITGRDGKFWQDVALQRIKEIQWIEAAAKEAKVDPNKVLPAVAAPGEKPVGA